MAKNISVSVKNKSKNQIEISFDYDEEIKEDVKKIPGRDYRDSSQSWIIPLNERNLIEFLSFCQKYDQKISEESLKEVVNEVKEKAQEKQRKYDKNREIANRKEPELDKVYGLSRGLSLRPFQRVAVEYIEKNKQVLIGDEMGAGKTVMTIGALEHMELYPALIVVPASLKNNWKNECEKWLPNKRSISVINASDDNPTFRRRIIIINYALLTKYMDELLEKDFEVIISDESHYLKNPDANRTKAFKKISQDIPHRILLSGTPVTNRPKELISQLKILNEDMFNEDFGGFWEFVQRYCDAKQTKWGLDIDGASNLEELHKKLKGTCYIRRNKEDVLDQLPDKVRKAIKFEIDNRSDYEKAKEDVIEYLREKALQDEDFQKKLKGKSKYQKKRLKKRRIKKVVGKALGAQHLVRLSELRKIAAKGKFSSITRWIDDFLESGEKLVLFAHHTNVADTIEEKYDCLKITGEVPSEDRQEIVDNFQNDPDEQLIVLNIEAGGVGITLTAASHVAFIELPWTPADLNQAEDRLHRIGQENAVNVYYLLAKDTIDETIHSLIQEKREITKKINAGKTTEEIEDEIDIKKELAKNLLDVNENN